MRQSAVLFLFLHATIVFNLFELGYGQSDTLLLVQAVWRHGGRSPTTTFANDAYQASAWPHGFGQLTTNGMQSQFILGQRLRARYASFWNAAFTVNEIYVRSTNVDRTIQSSYANQLGFYRNVAVAQVDYPLYQPWPTGTMPYSNHINGTNVLTDNVLVPDATCPRQAAIQALWSQTPEYQNINNIYGSLLSQLTSLSGTSITLANLWTELLWDALEIEATFGKTLPSWATPALINGSLAFLRDFSVGMQTGQNLAPLNGFNFQVEVPKVRGGTLLALLISNMQGRLSCLAAGGTGSVCSAQLANHGYFYSAHDTTVSAIMTALGSNHTNLYPSSGNGPYYPYFCDTVLVELWAAGGNINNPYVRVFNWPYLAGQNGTIELTGNYAGCSSTSCPLSSFIAATQKYIPQPDVYTLCANTSLYGGSG